MALLFGALSWNVYCWLGYKGVCKRVGAERFAEIMAREQAYYISPTNFFSGIFQEHLENATSDHFPVTAIYQYLNIKRWVARMTLGILPASSTPLLPIGGNILLFDEKKLLVKRPELYSENYKKAVTIRSNYYNDLIKENPSINLFVFPVLHKQDWLVMCKEYFKIDSGIFAGDKYVNVFRTLLDPRIGYSWGGENVAPERALMFYYKTDHHFNMPGAYTVYRGVVNLLRETVKDMTEPLEPKRWFSVPNVAFRGSNARRGGGYESLFEVIEDGEFDLPVSQVLINGVDRKGKHNKKLTYLGGSIPSGDFIDHYDEYFGTNYACLEVINNNNNRNLLQISDSYDNSMVPLLSSHYKHSFFIDLRNYKRVMGESFNFKKFVYDNKIDDVVFFGSQSWILGMRSIVEN